MSRGAAGRSLLLIVTLGALVALSAWSLASARPASRAATNAASREAALSDDDAETALFELTALVPGQTQSRCITVSNDGPMPDGIRLIGSAEGGDLREFLRFQVDAGPGGRFGDCKGFGGRQVFDGTLAQFVGLHHDYESGLVALTPTQTGSTTFRLRVTLDDVAAAQGETATATFAWEARSGAISVEPPPLASETQPQPGPEAASARDSSSPKATRRTPDSPRQDRGTPAPPGAASPSQNGTPAARGGASRTLPNAPRTRARPDPSRPSRKRDRSAASTKPAPAAPAARRSPREAERSWLDAIAALVAPLVQRSAFPLVLLIIAGLFLLVQNRLDRRDPKLAQAPLHAQPDLPFLPPPSLGDAST